MPGVLRKPKNCTDRISIFLISIPYSIWISYSKETPSCIWNQQFITFSQGFFGTTVNDQQHTIVAQLYMTITRQTGHPLTCVHICMEKYYVLDLDLCTLFPLSSVVRNDMHFNLPKAMLVFWQQHATSIT